MTKTDLTNLALAKIGERSITSLDDPNDKNARHAALHYGQARDEVLRAHFWGFALRSADLAMHEPRPRVSGVPDEAGGTWINGTYNEIGTYNGRKQWRHPGLVLTVGILQWSGTRWDLTHGPQTVYASEPGVFSPDRATTWTPQVEGYGGEVKVESGEDPVLGWDECYDLPADFLKLRQVMSPEGGRVDRFDLRLMGGKRVLLGPEDGAVIEYVSRVDEPDLHDPLFTAAFVTLLASRLARAITGSEQLEQSLLQRYEQVDLPAARTADGHDSRSAENHPLEELLESSLTGRRQ
jgi:hypothetical protein